MKRHSVVVTTLALGLTWSVSFAQLNRERGNGPDGIAQLSFFSHRLGTDHAEGISTMDMNNDGRPDLLSGSYWYENPGPAGGSWKRHQYRTVEYLSADSSTEFVSDCGEWVFDVNHDGAPDMVT